MNDITDGILYKSENISCRIIREYRIIVMKKVNECIEKRKNEEMICIN